MGRGHAKKGSTAGAPEVHNPSIYDLRNHWLHLLEDKRMLWQDPQGMRMTALIIDRFFAVSKDLGYSGYQLAPGLHLALAAFAHDRGDLSEDGGDDVEKIFWEQLREMGDEVFFSEGSDLRIDQANPYPEETWRVVRSIADQAAKDLSECSPSWRPVIRGMLRNLLESVDAYEQSVSDAAAAARIEQRSKEILGSAAAPGVDGRSHAQQVASRFARELRER